jgi:hypothetical protein
MVLNLEWRYFFSIILKGDDGVRFGDAVQDAWIYSPKIADPNQRMRLAGSSLIARVYHSVALLLPDGRVWIAGSNPKGKVSLILQNK